MGLSLLAVWLPLINAGGARGSGGIHKQDPIGIPFGKAINVDGTISQGEWDDAATVEIRASPDWVTRIRLKHDKENLYFAFERLASASERLFPEILLDPENRRSESLERGQWWFHISGNLCEGNGEVNTYTRNEVFQCSHEKSGWAANNPPTPDIQVVEVRVSFAKLGMELRGGMTIGIAFDLTNATGDATQKWFFWPASAKLTSPKTWAEAILE